jgi:glycosyltransferase involved in cell wall biosynthesis
MAEFPLVSIVTPSYNQAQYLEETMLSVLDQEYPKLEYIVIDGGSTDQSVEIIRKYERRLAYWISEPDQGQSDALNKGFARATGEIVAYLNSDDVYLPDAIVKAVSVFQADPEVAVVHGDSRFVDATGKVIGEKRGLEGDFLGFFLEQINPISQPSAFWTKSAMNAVGGIDLSLHMAMDYDLWCRIGLRGMRIEHIQADLSLYRIHRDSKTRKNVLEFAQERWMLLERYLADPALSAKLMPHRNRLLAMAHLRLANAYWLCGQSQSAYTEYRQVIRTAPQCIVTRQGLSLLARFALQRRSLRGRFAEQVE